MIKQEKGFTLVELAISLVVIGLLIGGILKGQELIENGKIASTARMMTEYKTAALAFRNTYDEYPGDIQNPRQRIPNCTTDSCQYGGDGDDKVSGYSSGHHDVTEMHGFFVHISRAGFGDGPPGGTDTMATNDTDADRAAFFPKTRLASGSAGRAPYLVLEYIATHAGTPPSGVTALKPKHYYIVTTNGNNAFKLDSKLDDGMPLTGDIRDYQYAGCYDTTGGFVSAAPYNRNAGQCRLKITAGF